MMQALPHQRAAYERTWRELNKKVVVAVDPDLVATPGLVSPDVERFFAAQLPSRFYALNSLTAEDEANLVAQGLQLSALRENLERSLLKGRRRTSTDPHRFQIDAVEEGCLYAACPFTGQLLVSRTSIVGTREVIFYRFDGAEVFYVATGHLGSGFTKGALYFPEREMVVKSRDVVWGLRHEHIIKLKALMVSNAASVARYIANGPRRSPVAVCLGEANYAHHLWNELSGLQRLWRAHRLASVDRFFVFREPLGAIPLLFPEIPAEKVRYQDTDSDGHAYIPDTMFREIVQDGCFVINVGDDYISEDLVKRVQRVARNSVPARVAEKIQRVRHDYQLLILVTIRTGNRTWIDQAAGLSTMLLRLAESFPSLGVVIDGYSLAADYDTDSSLRRRLRPSDYELQVLAEEADVIRDIRTRLARSGVGVFSISGCSLLETTLWVSEVDLYIAHAGSNQHKIGWLSNKPGIVHSNAEVLRRNQNGRSYYHKVREFGIPPVFIAPHFVRDIPTSASQQTTELRDDLSNYDIDVSQLSEQVEAMARSLVGRRSGTRVIPSMLGSLRRRVYRSRFAHDARLRLGRSSIGTLLRSMKRAAARQKG
jgi:hypothetical protein